MIFATLQQHVWTPRRTLDFLRRCRCRWEVGGLRRRPGSCSSKIVTTCCPKNQFTLLFSHQLLDQHSITVFLDPFRALLDLWKHFTAFPSKINLPQLHLVLQLDMLKHHLVILLLRRNLSNLSQRSHRHPWEQLNEKIPLRSFKNPLKTHISNHINIQTH